MAIYDFLIIVYGSQLSEQMTRVYSGSYLLCTSGFNRNLDQVKYIHIIFTVYNVINQFCTCKSPPDCFHFQFRTYCKAMNSMIEIHQYYKRKRGNCSPQKTRKSSAQTLLLNGVETWRFLAGWYKKGKLKRLSFRIFDLGL